MVPKTRTIYNTNNDNNYGYSVKTKIIMIAKEAMIKMMIEMIIIRSARMEQTFYFN